MKISLVDALLLRNLIRIHSRSAAIFIFLAIKRAERRRRRLPQELCVPRISIDLFRISDEEAKQDFRFVQGFEISPSNFVADSLFPNLVDWREHFDLRMCCLHQNETAFHPLKHWRSCYTDSRSPSVYVPSRASSGAA